MTNFDPNYFYKLTWIVTNAFILIYSICLIIYVGCYRKKAFKEDV
jgi:hypothetical protein